MPCRGGLRGAPERVSQYGRQGVIHGGWTMRDSDVPVKTAAGQREIAQRQLKLQSKTRSLLIAVHGEHSVGQLRQQFQALGDVGAILEELSGLGLVTAATSAVAGGKVPAPTVAANEEVPAPQLAKQFMNETAVAALGLRAFLFTLKLEHCYNAEELRGLLPEYQRVLGKAKGEMFGAAMAARVEGMLRGA